MISLFNAFGGFCLLRAMPLPPLADAVITQLTTTDGTFGGATTFIAKAFWAFMMLCFAVGVLSGMVSIAMTFRQQEVPVMAFVTIGCMLALPTMAFIMANMMKLTAVTNLFNFVAPPLRHIAVVPFSFSFF